MRVLCVAVLFTSALVACGGRPGDPCTATGDGFTRSDSCERGSQCVTWEVTCDGGDAVIPDVCAGAACDDHDDCQDGWGCARVNATDRECLPLSVCPEGFELGEVVDLD